MSKVKIGLLASEAPPPSPRRGFLPLVEELLPALREQSGTWFRVREFASVTTAGHLRTKLQVHPDYEWASRTTPNGSVLYGRHRKGRAAV